MVVLCVYARSCDCTCICVFAWVVDFVCSTGLGCFNVAMRFWIFSDGEDPDYILQHIKRKTRLFDQGLF